MTRLSGGAHTDVGRVRSANQDAALAHAAVGLYAVADGMGGHRGGEVASALALQALERELASVRVGAGLVDSVDTVVEAVLAANDAVYQEAVTSLELHGMGTTLCVLALTGSPGQQQVAVANVGDSRVYVLHGGQLAQLTEDHSLVQGLVRDGQLTADEAAVHPNRNILTRVIGVEPDVEVDWWEWPATVGDRYLLCSDGLFNEVPDDRIAATLRQLADPAEACRALVALANAAGGRDNVTAVVVDVV
ncbi:MAG: Stp1/IreP family PP2C-type Ser/Thr phosphatase, partial [Acidimicrobiales bacterium]